MAQVHELPPRCKIRGLLSRRCDLQFHCGECPKARRTIVRLTNIAAAERYLHSDPQGYRFWDPIIVNPNRTTTIGLIANPRQPEILVATITRGELHRETLPF